MAGLSTPRLIVGTLNLIALVMPAAFGWAWLNERNEALTVFLLGGVFAAVILVYRRIQHWSRGRSIDPVNEILIVAGTAVAGLPATLTYALVFRYYTWLYVIAAVILGVQIAHAPARAAIHRITGLRTARVPALPVSLSHPLEVAR